MPALVPEDHHRCVGVARTEPCPPISENGPGKFPGARQDMNLTLSSVIYFHCKTGLGRLTREEGRKAMKQD